MFPEALYVLSARDRQVTWLDPFYFFRTFGAGTPASAALDGPPVPEGRVLLLNHVMGNGQPAAAEFGIWAYLQVLDGSNVTRSMIDEVYEKAGGGAGTGGNGLTVRNRTPLVLLPGFFIRFVHVKNAGVSSQTMELGMSGIYVPIANIQRG